MITYSTICDEQNKKQYTDFHIEQRPVF